MDRARDSGRSRYDHARSGRIWFRHGCDRGWSSCLATPSVGGERTDGPPDNRMLPKAFTGKRAFSEFTTPAVISKVMGGKRPARPQEGQELGLTDSMWDMTVRCWHQDPAQRPMMTEVVGLLRELLVSSLSIEADLNDLLQAYKTWDKDGQGKKAQEFADRLDKVCHTEGYIIASPQHI